MLRERKKEYSPEKIATLFLLELGKKSFLLNTVVVLVAGMMTMMTGTLI